MIPNIVNQINDIFNGKNTECVETAHVYDDTSGGILGDKLSLHVVPIIGKKNLYMNRISYNTQTDAYYENGILSNKYLKRWNEGASQWDNIKLKIEYDWRTIYLARNPDQERMNDDGEISWRFDYHTGGYIINSLNLRLSFTKFDDSAKVQWFIKPLPTIKTPNPSWQLIPFEPSKNHVNEVMDVTQFVKNEYGFILKANLSGGEEEQVRWQKAQLFRQTWSLLSKDLNVDDDNAFGLDLKVELKPDVIVDSPPKSYDLKDESTKDFVIHYIFTTDEDENADDFDKEVKDFRVHSRILTDHFGELMESQMIEPQNKSITLTDSDISYESLEIIINYIYTGMLQNINSYDEWITLLRYASRFHIPTLVQRCEKALKGYLNHGNLSEVKTIADECGAEQLLRCCEGFELQSDQELINIQEN